MMQTRKVVIIGAGHVGSHVALALLQAGQANDIVLIDKDREKAATRRSVPANTASFKMPMCWLWLSAEAAVPVRHGWICLMTPFVWPMTLSAS